MNTEYRNTNTRSQKLGRIVLDSPSKKYLTHNNDTDNDMQSLYHRITNDLDSVREWYEQRQILAQRNQRFYWNEQWSQEELAAFERQNRYPFQFNEVHQKLNHLRGMQRQLRVDVAFEPERREDVPGVELLSRLVKWAETKNDFKQTESSVFEDAILDGVGFYVVRWKMKDTQYGFPAIEKVPSNEMYWDMNSKHLDLSDARWMIREMLMTRMDAIECYPEYAEAIDAAVQLGMRFNDPILNPRQQWMQRKNSSTREEGRQQIRIIEHYERIVKLSYIVSDAFTGKEEEFDNRVEAQGFYDALCDGYVEKGEVLQYENGDDKIELLQTSEDLIIQSLVIGNEVVRSVPTGLPTFPYVPFFSYFKDGYYWAFADYLIDPQIAINRAYSQFDYQLGASPKNALTVMPQMLAHGWGAEDVRREISKTAPIIPVKAHGAIQPLPNGQVTPELFSIIQFASSKAEEYAGGRSALGMSNATSHVSGRAHIALQEMAGMTRLPFFDNLAVARRNVMWLVSWYIKNFMKPGQVARIVGTDLGTDVEFIDIDNGVMDTLGELLYDVRIDETLASGSVRERIFNQLTDFFRTNPMPGELAMPLLLEYSSIPEKLKQEIKGMSEFLQQYTQQKAQVAQEEKLKAQAEQTVRRKQMREQLEQGQSPDVADSMASAQQGGSPRQPQKINDPQMDSLREALLQAGGDPATRNALQNSVNTPEEMSNRFRQSMLANMGIGNTAR